LPNHFFLCWDSLVLMVVLVLVLVQVQRLGLEPSYAGTLFQNAIFCPLSLADEPSQTVTKRCVTFPPW
jgi:hypothetical protein